MRARLVTNVILSSLLLAGGLLQSGCGAKAVGPLTYDEEAMAQAKPWTSEAFMGGEEDFRFAVVGDRTGGANPAGTFAIAMDQLNLMRPEFVTSVGNYIEGYTNDKDELNAQWKEVDGIVAKLQMPIFYTVGNHDASTPASKEVWKERHGPGYYYYVYKKTLFIALDTEDFERPPPPPTLRRDLETYNRLQKDDPAAAQEWLNKWMGSEGAKEAFGIGAKVEFPKEQIDWLKRTLAQYPDVRWTFVFVHEPVWDNPSESFEQIRSLLKGRKHTFFAGHTHYYDYDNIDGVDYITMGPAGATFHKEGPGNVDHIMWVTMTGAGPQLANIALKGLFDRKGLDPEMFGAYDRSGKPDAKAAGTTETPETGAKAVEEGKAPAVEEKVTTEGETSTEKNATTEGETTTEQKATTEGETTTPGETTTEQTPTN